MNIDVIIKRYSDNTPLYGVIKGFEPKPFGKMQRWLFLNNLDKEEFSDTNNISLFIPIDHADIIFIDYQIK